MKTLDLTAASPGSAVEVSRGPADAWFTPLRFAIVLTVFLLVAFWKVATGQHSFFYRDYGAIGYGFVYYHHESFWRGELPLWNPYSNCGAPFMAQWGTMVLYPLSLIYLVFPLPWSLSYFCLGHLLLGGVGMYFLARRWAGTQLGASLAGFAYVINGATFGSLIWPNYAVALGWMPWVVSLVEQAWANDGRKVVLAALAAALQILSGVPELVVFTWLALGVLWAWHFIRTKEARWPMTKRTLVIVLFVAGLTAAQILPFLDLLAHSQRDRGFADTRWPMPIWGWANLLVPLFHCFETPQGIFFQYDQGFLSSYYLGVGILMLAMFALWRVRRTEVWLLGGLTLFSLIMALGENGLLYAGLKKVFPLLAVGRFPIKFVFLSVFAIPLLAAFAFSFPARSQAANGRGAARMLCLIGIILGGLILAILWFARSHPLTYDQWGVTWKNGLFRGVFLVGFIGIVVAMVRTTPVLPPIVCALLLFGIHGADILTHVPPQNPTIPVTLFEPGLATNQFPVPAPAHGDARAMISPSADQALANNTVSDFSKQFLGKRLALWSNLNLLDHVPKVNGSSTLQLLEQSQVQKRLYALTNGAPAGLLDFLGVSLVTTPGKIVEWTARDGALPLVTIGARPVFADQTNTFDRIFAADFNPRTEVYLPLETKSFITATNQVAARITSRQASAHRIEFEAATGQTCLAVVAQSYYHRWQAYVDGRQTPIWRANFAFQAIEIPGGTHQVKLIYQDERFQTGAAISLLTVCLCGVSYYRGRKN